MHRIDGQDNDNGRFKDENLQVPQPGTVMTSAWANAIQEEIVNVILASGASLIKAVNTQLLTALNAMYGRLDTANTWAGNQSFGGTVGVTGTTTLSGPANLNGATTVNATLTPAAGSAAVDMGPGSADHVFLRFRARTSSPSAQSGYIGYPAAGDATLRLRNDLAGQDIAISPNAGRVAMGGNIVFAGVANPAGTTAFTNTITPVNICKARALIVTNGVGGATILKGFNVASVSVIGGDLVLTFAAPFADSNYTCEVVSDGIHHVRPSAQTASTLTIDAFVYSAPTTPGTYVDDPFLTGIKRVHVVVYGEQ